MKKLLLLPLIIILLTGCLGYNELDNLMIINNIYINKINSSYKIILNEVVASRDEAELSKNYKISSVTCSSIDKCFNEFKKFPKTVYLSHLKNILIDEDIKKNELYKLIDNLNNFKELREDFYIVFINDKNYSKTIKNSSLQTFLNHNKKSITFYDLKKSYINKNDISIPVVKEKENNFSIKKLKKINWR